MPILPGREKRKIYARKLKTFWQDFSHNRIGLVGMIIILFYVFVALFAEELTPYPPIAGPRVSNGFAMPSWVSIFPQYRNLPPTLFFSFNWTPVQEYQAISMDYGDGETLNYHPTDGIGQLQNYTLTSSFNYTYDTPGSFETYLSWKAQFSNVSYRLELWLKIPNGQQYIIFGTDYNVQTKHVEILDSIWNLTVGDWTTTSGSIDLRIRMDYEVVYQKYFQQEYGKYMAPLRGDFYNSTLRIQQHIWNATHGGSLVGFDSFWYGPTGYWNTTGEAQWETIYQPRYDLAARSYADSIALQMADQESLIFSPADVCFSSKGTYTLMLTVFVQPFSENAQLKMDFSPSSKFTIWGSLHGILGSDSFGKDVFTQLVYGARISLIVGILAALLSTSLGIFFGVTSGYLGGITDEIIMRVVDVLLCLPLLPILLALISYFKPNVYFVVLLIAIFGWQGLSRVIRSRVLSLREMPFVESARASGASNSYLIYRHLIPNVFPIAIASMILAVPGAILTEAALSFLGFGDPFAPTWGKMLHEAQSMGAFSQLAWWYILPPGFAITFLCVAFVFVGHALDEIVNPRLRRRR